MNIRNVTPFSIPSETHYCVVSRHRLSMSLHVSPCLSIYQTTVLSDMFPYVIASAPFGMK